MDSEDKPTRLRRAAPGILAAFLSLALLEGVSRVALPLVNTPLSEHILAPRVLVDRHRAGIRAFLDGDGGVSLPDTLLGWRYRPGYAEAGDTINEQGLRASRAYAPDPEPGVLRLAGFGDSFVYCAEVANPDCWAARSERAGEVEVMNYGVGGYGTDQAFLRYLREGGELHADIVIIGFAPTNLGRIVNRYRGFISSSEGPWMKPRFQFEDGTDQLRLIPTPLRSYDDAQQMLESREALLAVGEGDWWYESTIYTGILYRWSAAARLATGVWIRLKRRMLDPGRLYDGGVFNTESEAFELQRAVGLAFADSVRADGAEPIFLVFPSREDVAAARGGGDPSYGPLTEAWRSAGLEVLDPLAGLREHPGPVEELFAPAGHYSPAGNAIVAARVSELVDQYRPGPDPGL